MAYFASLGGAGPRPPEVPGLALCTGPRCTINHASRLPAAEPGARPTHPHASRRIPQEILLDGSTSQAAAARSNWTDVTSWDLESEKDSSFGQEPARGAQARGATPPGRSLSRTSSVTIGRPTATAGLDLTDRLAASRARQGGRRARSGLGLPGSRVAYHLPSVLRGHLGCERRGQAGGPSRSPARRNDTGRRFL
jgi:hypothetical protein